ncbi:MAG: hypothetical protein ACOX8P_02750 [Tepidanaerobacteraceae bacterium]
MLDVLLYIINSRIVTDLSEKVAKIKIEGNTSFKVEDKFKVIPNHACTGKHDKLSWGVIGMGQS